MNRLRTSIAALATFLMVGSSFAQFNPPKTALYDEDFVIPYGLKTGSTRTYLLAHNFYWERNILTGKIEGKSVVPAVGSHEAIRQLVEARRQQGKEAYLMVYPYLSSQGPDDGLIVSNEIRVKLGEYSDYGTALMLAAKHQLTLLSQAADRGGWVSFKHNSILKLFEAVNGLRMELPMIVERAEVVMVPRTETRRVDLNDPLYPAQWYLERREPPYTPDDVLNTIFPWVPVFDAWCGDPITGFGAVSGLNQTIAVIDDGLELNHPDMRPATFAGDHFDLIDGDKDPTPFPFDAHGTAVAAIAGARGDNLNGMAGIAYRSNLAGIRFLGAPPGSENLQRALNHGLGGIPVRVASFGFQGRFEPPDPAAVEALRVNSLGSVYAWAAGDDGQFGESPDYRALETSRHVITVGSVVPPLGFPAVYTEPGASVFISAPSGQGPAGNTQMLTADLVGSRGFFAGDYRNDFAGTSASAALVGGSVALMRERNPLLGTKDIQWIIVQTSSFENPVSRGFAMNPATGAGMINPTAAVDLARDRLPIPASEFMRFGTAARDLNSPSGGIYQRTLEGPNAQMRLEHVEISFRFADGSADAQGRILLISPWGTLTNFGGLPPADNLPQFPHPPPNPRASWPVLPEAWQFSSVQHWGEVATGNGGVWTLIIESDDDRLLMDWEVVFYGILNNDPPVVESATLTPTGQTFDDVPLVVNGITASDPEDDDFFITVQFQYSPNGVNFFDVGPLMSLPYDKANPSSLEFSLDPSFVSAGNLYRAQVRGVDRKPGDALTTEIVIVDSRPVTVAEDGQFYYYDATLFINPQPPADQPVFAINEFSQGLSGNKEWVEFMIIAQADYRGWSFGNSYAATNDIIFNESEFWRTLVPGTLLVIYNGTDRDTLLPPDDYDPSDGLVVVSGTNTNFFTPTPPPAWPPLTFDPSSLPVDPFVWPTYSNTDFSSVVVNDRFSNPLIGLSWNGDGFFTDIGQMIGNMSAYASSTDDQGMLDPANWFQQPAANATPGATNDATNEAHRLDVIDRDLTLIPSYRFIDPLTAEPLDEPPVPNLTIDRLTGEISGVIDFPGGGVIPIAIEIFHSFASRTQQFELVISPAAGGVGGELAGDLDGDGFVTMVERAFGTSDLKANTAAESPGIETVSVDGKSFAAIRFPILPTGAFDEETMTYTAQGYEYRAEISKNLKDWDSNPDNVALFELNHTTTENTSGVEMKSLCIRATEEMGDEPTFLRVVITRLP